jgi:hypothetical protein
MWQVYKRMGETQLPARFLECEFDAVSSSLVEGKASSINQSNRVPVRLLTGDNLEPCVTRSDEPIRSARSAPRRTVPADKGTLNSCTLLSEPLTQNQFNEICARITFAMRILVINLSFYGSLAVLLARVPAEHYLPLLDLQ